MQRRLNFLPFLIMVGVTAYGLFGCTQSEDIVTPISSTEISLSVERLPKPPAGMFYEAWVASSKDTISLGRFSWDPDGRRFLDADSGKREIPGTFMLPHDILNFRTMFISIEDTVDDVSSSPGPIMLIDDITETESNNIILRFPKIDSLWMNNTGFSLEATSDTSRDGHNGYGVWFATYGRVNDVFVDTFQIYLSIMPDSEIVIPGGSSRRIPVDTVYHMDSIERIIPFAGPNFLLRQPNADSARIHIGVDFEFAYIDTSGDTLIDTIIDTLIDTTASIIDTTIDTIIDTIPLELTYIGPVAKVDSVRVIPRLLIWDFFIGEDWIFPDMSAYGWTYKGWALTPYLNAEPMTTRWRFTPPVYRYQIGGTNMFPGDTGVLLPTGEFGSTQGPDEGDPFSLPNRRAPYPGEDFLNAEALHSAFGIDSVNLLPNTTGNIGTIFISLEPINRVTDTTNFPLIVTSAPIPANRVNLNPPAGNGIKQFLMKPLTGTVRGDLYGFPAAYVTITRR